MFPSVEQIVPNKETISLTELRLWNAHEYVLDVFDDRLIAFFDRFSRNVLKDPQINRQPEIVALAFWLRKSNLAALKKDHDYWNTHRNVRVQPLGKVFHVCPANVDTMFLYSLAISWLCGNMNIVRVSRRAETATVQQLFKHINELLATSEFRFLADYVSVITYDHNADINAFICENVNGRILWGGDKTIETFRSFKTIPKVKDICFADRISFTVIKSGSWLKLSEAEKKENLVKLYNDSFIFDQMGCASPQTLCFYGSGNENTSARLEIYDRLSAIVREKYNEDRTALAALKLNRLADDSINNNLQTVMMKNTGLVFASASGTDISHKSCGGGFFYVTDLTLIEELKSHITSRHQTLSYIGLDDNDKESLLQISRGLGIDRIVPVGMALDFNNYWDGYKLSEELVTRKFVI